MVELRAHSAERAGLESAAGSGMVSRQTSSVSRRKRGRRSRSAPRLLDTNKPKKQNKYLDTATSSISSLPSRIQLTMLNSGLIPIADEDKAIRAIPRKPIEKGNFVKYCEQHRKYPILFKVEFQHAGRVEAHPTRHGTKSCNEIKNQNHKIVPYDYNRVVLDPQRDPDSPDGTVGTVSDYINASYVDSLLKPNAYIVTQGPNERTVNDLWRMVWKERSPSIVMLTKTFDFIKVMCVQYWPSQPDKEELYGTIRVTVLKEEQLANFVIRSIRLRQGSEERSLLQLHYTEWPCHSCPFSNAILEFRRRIRICLNNRVPDLDGPTIVHCSDGAGRSGVFLAIDANIELAEEDGLFDIYGYLKKIRQARRGLIETVDQYRFVYDTLEEYVCCGYSSFPVSELSQRLKEKAVRLSGDKQNDYQREFSQICRQVPKFTIGDCAGGHRADNRHKNRDVMIVPPDNFRPYLTSFQGNAATDYINAVFVDGYNRSKEYIVTEWPLRATPSDFWSLAYDFSCNSIVVLTNPGDTAGYSHPREYIVTEWVLPPSVADLWSLVYDYDAAAVVVLCNPDASPNFPPFWPENTRSKKYGTVFTVEHISHQHYQNIKSWIFRINKKIVSLTELMAGVKADSKTCQLFQLTCWPVGYKVPTSTNALVELMNMVERWRQRSGYGPVIVVSPDGQCRAGVYCAANACIEQVVQHSEVDVFQAVKTVRRHRPQLISNMPQQPAPFFKAQAVVNGEFKEISLDDYKGKYLVLFFYPLEFTFVCPTEIIAFSEAAKKFRDINCEVLACSTDFHFSHLAWINTPRKMGGLGEMDIPLLADKNMAISRAYGVLKEDEGVPFRGLFIIDGSSTLRQLIINDLPVGRSVDEVLRLAQAYQFTDEHGEMEYKYCYDLVLHYVLHYLNKDHPAH